MAKQDTNLLANFGLSALFNYGGIQPKNILNFTDNNDITMYHLMSMFQKTNSMFEYGGDFGKGKSELIEKRYLEMLVQLKGYCCISEVKGKLYCNFGTLGGEPRYDYLPSKFIVNNPYIPINKQYTIDKDCVLFKNDMFGWGLYPLNLYYAVKLRDNDQSRRVMMITSRAMQILYSTDTDTTKAIKQAYRELEKGELSAIFDDNVMGEQLKSIPFGAQQSSQTFIQLLEDYQYNKGSWWNEMGIQNNYNMKRETITSSENILNIDSLLPFSDNMLNARKENIDKINKMFGTNWTVDFGSAWKKLRNEIAVSQDVKKEQKDNVDKSEFHNVENDSSEDSNEDKKE